MLRPAKTKHKNTNWIQPKIINYQLQC